MGLKVVVLRRLRTSRVFYKDLLYKQCIDSKGSDVIGHSFLLQVDITTHSYEDGDRVMEFLEVL